MARRSSGGRSGGGFSRSAPKPSKSTNPSPTPAPVKSVSTTGGLGSVVAEGMAFGGGSAIAHRAVDAMMGPRVVHHETVASGTPGSKAARSIGVPDACVGQYKAFEDCLNISANEISRCQFYMDMLAECRKAGLST